MTDEVITDSLPPENPDANYDKSDPPMTVGTLYSNMDAFKLALASHATNMSFIITLKRVIKLGTRCTAVAEMWAAGGDFMPLH